MVAAGAQLDARVSIDATGTVKDGALWLEESLPAESVLIGLLARIQEEQLERLCALSGADRAAAAALIRRAIKNPRLKEQIDALCAEMKILAP